MEHLLFHNINWTKIKLNKQKNTSSALCSISCCLLIRTVGLLLQDLCGSLIVWEKSGLFFRAWNISGGSGIIDQSLEKFVNFHKNDQQMICRIPHLEEEKMGEQMVNDKRIQQLLIFVLLWWSNCVCSWMVTWSGNLVFKYGNFVVNIMCERRLKPVLEAVIPLSKHFLSYKNRLDGMFFLCMLFLLPSFCFPPLQMNASNLAVCFAPSLFNFLGSHGTNSPRRQRKTPGVPEQRELLEQKAVHECFTYMITDCKKLFMVGGRGTIYIYIYIYCVCVCFRSSKLVFYAQSTGEVISEV